MSNEQGGVSFGFAPQGRTSHQHGEKPRKFKIDDKKTASTARYDASTYSYPTSKSNLAWLCIGILLGAGVTLIGSSIWLQGSYVNPSVAMDVQEQNSRSADDQSGFNGPSTNRSTQKEAPEETSQARNVAEKPGNDREALNKSNQQAQAKRDATPAPRPSFEKTERGASTQLAANSQDTQSEALLIGENDAQPPLPEERIRDRAEPNVKQILERAKNTLEQEAVSARDQRPKPRVAPDAASEDKELETTALDNAVQGINQANKDEIKTLIKAGTPKPSPSGRIYRVQLAAVDNERAAEVYWQEVRSRIPDLVTGIEPTFDRGEVDKRIFYRIWIGEFEERGDADSYCGQLKSKGQDCFVTRG